MYLEPIFYFVSVVYVVVSYLYTPLENFLKTLEKISDGYLSTVCRKS